MTWIRRHPIITVILGLLVLVGLGAGDPVGYFGSLLVILLVVAPIWWCVAKLKSKLASWNARPGLLRGPKPSPYLAVPSMPVTMSVLDRPAMASHLQAARTPAIGDVLALTPGQFEELTVKLLEAMGYKDARRTGGSGDLGADVVCRDPQGSSTIVQCKRYAPGSSIGAPVVQTFIGMISVHHRADRGIVVSTSGFTLPAVDLARQHGITLIDGNALLVLLHLTGVQLVPTAITSMPGRVYCSRCGIENRTTDRYCASCGAQLSASARTPYTARQ